MLSDDASRYRPLTLFRFGIELRRMTESDKEIVRSGRNRDFVRRNHVYRDIISTAEHEIWFREMSAPSHYIMVIHYHARKVGVVIVKDIPPDLSMSTCGAFIWDEECLGSKVPILSILMALDFFYFTIGVMGTESVVLKSNIGAIKMNRFFGFDFQERDPDSFRITMDLARYLSNRDRLIAFAKRATKNREHENLVIHGSQSLLNLPEINALLIK